MKVTLDTNVLISATFWYGASHKIIEKAERKELNLILSKDILLEYARVLEYEEIQEKIRDKNLEMKHTLKKIMSIATIVNSKEKLRVVKEDHDDDKILECAKAGNVNYIISQDKHLLRLKQFNKIPIITPEEFTKIIN